MKAGNPLRIALVAGEDSGDLLGAELISGLRRLRPDCEIRAVAGPKMRQADVAVIHQAEDFSVMGFGEVIRHLPRLLRLRRKIVRQLLDFRPHVMVGIDAPDLNLPIEARLKRRGIKTVHYVSPSVWAWRSGRAEKIAASTDSVLTLFPFEPDWYIRHGGQARFVGHPLAQAMPLTVDKDKEKQRAGLLTDGPVIALLPGSRWHEIRGLGPDFLQAAVLLRQRWPNAVFVTASPAGDKARWFAGAAAGIDINVRPMKSAGQALLAADVALLASGTVALEAMLAKTPMVVAYRVAPLTHALVKGLRLMQQPWYSLPNVLQGDFLVPEIMQKAISPAGLAEAVVGQLERNNKAELIHSFTRHHQNLLPPRPDAAAQAVLEAAGC